MRSPEIQQERTLAEEILGYEHPEAHRFQQHAARVLTVDGPDHLGIPGSSSYTSLLYKPPTSTHPLKPAIQKLQGEFRAFINDGVFVDCGSGDNPANSVASAFGAKDTVTIDIKPRRGLEMHEHKEAKVGPDKTKRRLHIRDDIVHALSTIQSESVHALHLRALDVFVCDETLFWQEAFRVLKPGGFIFSDDSRGSWLHRNNIYTQYFEMLCGMPDSYGSGIYIFRKPLTQMKSQPIQAST